MTIKIQKQKEKKFMVKNYRFLWQLEEAMKSIKEQNSMPMQLSVIGKLGKGCIYLDKMILSSRKSLKEYWQGSLGIQTDFGIFCSPELGTLFITGFLTGQFLHELDGKVLGELPSGLYGILRGLGIGEQDAVRYLKLLNEGHLMLMVRVLTDQFDKLEMILENE